MKEKLESVRGILHNVWVEATKLKMDRENHDLLIVKVLPQIQKAQKQLDELIKGFSR